MKKAAVIGNPVAHSLSPNIFRFWFEALGINGSYEAILLEQNEIEPFLDQLRTGEFVGCNVTIPFKEEIFRKMDSLDKAAASIGAVNAVTVVGGGQLQGQNTDWTGFLENLEKHEPDWDAYVSTVLVVGAGGAARAVVYALLQSGKDIMVAGRNETKLTTFANSFDESRIRAIKWTDINIKTPKAQLIVNTTPLGMKGYDEVDIDFSMSPDSAIACDLVYHPTRTGFLSKASVAGLKTIGGLGMLVHQAVPAFKAWFGQQPPVNEDLYAILEMELKRRGHA